MLGLELELLRLRKRMVRSEEGLGEGWLGVVGWRDMDDFFRALRRARRRSSWVFGVMLSFSLFVFFFFFVFLIGMVGVGRDGGLEKYRWLLFF